MPSPEPYLIFTSKLQELGVRYMVSGSIAAIFYGEPRMTNYVDVIVFLRREDALRLPALFPPEEFYCPPLEVIESERSREQRGHFNLIHHETGSKADIYLAGRDPLHAWGIAHVTAVEIDGQTVAFAPPEYVMIRKLEFYREGGSSKHLKDVRRMLQGLGDDWPREKLLELLHEHRLHPEWERVMDFQD